jgi:hypothetical protein
VESRRFTLTIRQVLQAIDFYHVFSHGMVIACR